MTHCFRYESVSRQNVIGVQSPTRNSTKYRRTFDGRIVLVHEVALDELDGQSGLADACPPTHTIRQTARIPPCSLGLGLTTTTNDDEFILSQELGLISVTRSAEKPRNSNQMHGKVTRRTLDMFTVERTTNKTLSSTESWEESEGKKEEEEGTFDCVLSRSKVTNDNSPNKQISTTTLTSRSYGRSRLYPPGCRG